MTEGLIYVSATVFCQNLKQDTKSLCPARTPSHWFGNLAQARLTIQTEVIKQYTRNPVTRAPSSIDLKLKRA